MAERPGEMSGHVGRTEHSDETQELGERVWSDGEVEATRAQIELTRAEMTETVDALQDKLDPQRLKERARDTARSTGSDLLGNVGQNPVPVAVAGGLLLAMLLVGRLLRRRDKNTVVVDLRRGRAR
jgi:Protein of unknown function (DUF3618)